jgi:hypothetical protein
MSRYGLIGGVAALVAVIAPAFSSGPAGAAEKGIGFYLLGSSGPMAGFTPPPASLFRTTPSPIPARPAPISSFHSADRSSIRRTGHRQRRGDHGPRTAHGNLHGYATDRLSGGRREHRPVLGDRRGLYCRRSRIFRVHGLACRQFPLAERCRGQHADRRLPGGRNRQHRFLIAGRQTLSPRGLGFIP